MSAWGGEQAGERGRVPATLAPPVAETLRDVLGQSLKHLQGVHNLAGELAARLGILQMPDGGNNTVAEKPGGALHVAMDVRSGLLGLAERLQRIVDAL